MQTENIFIVHPANTEQVNALKAFVKALNIKFEETAIQEPTSKTFANGESNNLKLIISAQQMHINELITTDQ